MIWVITIILALIGGWLSRMCGGAPPKLPLGLDQWIYALPYMVISIPAVIAIAALIDSEEKKGFKKQFMTLLILPYAAAFAGKRTGHGGGMDLSNNPKEPGAGRDIEKLEYLILPLHGKISQYWYDAALLAITGLAVTLLPGIMICFADILSGILIIVSGALKAPAYMIGWAVYPQGKGKGIPHLNEATAIGEFLTGVFAYGALGMTAARLWGLT